MAKISLARIQELILDHALLTDYVYEDLSNDQDEEIEQAISQNDELANYVEDLLMIAITQDLSKRELRQIFVESKKEFLTWLSANK